MSLTALHSAEEIENARNLMLVKLRSESEKFRRLVGWQGGSEECDIYWNRREGFWFSSDHRPDGASRWFIFFGSENPEQNRMLDIDCEINPPKQGVNRQCAGVFLRDRDGALYLGHSGKIGGGRQGIGKSAFLASYRGALETVSWPDEATSEVIVLGRIDGERFAAHVADFIRSVRDFKGTVSGRNFPGSAPAVPPVQYDPTSAPRFVEEFSGQRRPYQPRSEIETRCDHGLIVNALARALRNSGMPVANDQNRDLYVPGHSGAMRILFEAKTDTGLTSVYQAIGQLQYHGFAAPEPPQLVMVLPGSPEPRTSEVLMRLGIIVLSFHWTENQVVFEDLDQITRILADNHGCAE